MSLARNIANLPNGDDAPLFGCRAWVNFRGTPQSGTATASGLITGLYTATVTSATQFTVEYAGTTYTINTSENHDLGNGESVGLTPSGTSITIDIQVRGSGNVSSVSESGVGDYTVNFENAMPGANYAAVKSAAFQAANYSADYTGVVSQTETAFRFNTGFTSNTSNTSINSDVTHIEVAVFK